MEHRLSRALAAEAWGHVLAYWAAQVAGAFAAVADLGATTPSGSDAQAFFWEAVLTALLLFVIMAVATDTRAAGEAAAIAIGGTIALASLAGGTVSGASLNPARALGPALVSGETTTLNERCAGPSSVS